MAGVITNRYFGDRSDRLVLDIGSNDGACLLAYERLGWRILGIDPALVPVRAAVTAGVPTVLGYFGADTSRAYKKSFDLITATGVFYHLENIHEVCDSIRECLKDDGIFACQCIYMKDVLASGTFDQIYHEHLLYYTFATLDRLLQKHGLHLFDAFLVPVHGGSFVALASKTPYHRTNALDYLFYNEQADGVNDLDTYLDFARRVHHLHDNELHRLDWLKKQEKTIYGLGAPAKGNTLLNYFGLTTRTLDYLVDRNPHHRGLYAPGSHIPILMEDEVKIHPDVYYVLAWNFREEILKRHADLIERGVQFLFPQFAEGGARV